MANIVIMGLLSVLGLLISVRLYCVHYVWGFCKSNISLKGKTVIITGSNSGIGRETAKQLAKRGARVVMACRDCDQTLNTIKQFNCQQLSANMVYKHIDLSSFDSVKRFAKDIIESEQSIHLLINNAAVFGSPFEVTEDGFENEFQVNHLSSALLTLLLLPKLESSSLNNDNSRVLMITSTLYRKGIIDENHFKRGYASIENFKKTETYSNSKLANILFSRKLYQNIVNEKKCVDIYIASPGIVWTQLNRHMNTKWWQILLLSPLALLFVRTPKQGIQTIIKCATEQNLTPDTLYRNCKENPWNQIVYDSTLSQKVYDLTLKAIESHLK